MPAWVRRADCASPVALKLGRGTSAPGRLSFVHLCYQRSSFLIAQLWLSPWWYLSSSRPCNSSTSGLNTLWMCCKGNEQYLMEIGLVVMSLELLERLELPSTKQTCHSRRIRKFELGFWRELLGRRDLRLFYGLDLYSLQRKVVNQAWSDPLKVSSPSLMKARPTACLGWFLGRSSTCWYCSLSEWRKSKHLELGWKLHIDRPSYWRLAAQLF